MEKEKECGFTLIELLGVLTVMAVIMAITVPAFKGLTKGYSMKAAVNQVRGDLSLARQYAMLNNATVIFMIPEPKNIGTFSSKTIDKCLKSYSVYDLTNKKYISDWKYLPEGISFGYFDTSITAPSGIGTYSNFIDYTTYEDIPFPDSSSGKSTFVKIDFLSDGTCSLKKPIVLFLTEAKVNWPANGGNPDPNNNAQYYELPNARKTAIIVYTTSGRFEVVDDV